MPIVYEKTFLSIKKLELFFPKMYNKRTNQLIKRAVASRRTWKVLLVFVAKRYV
jgi:hypothetical protein